MTKPRRLTPAPNNSGQERRWLLFTDRSVHGIKHSELTMVRKIAPQQTVRSTVSVFTVTKPFALVAGLVLLGALLLVLAGCLMPPAQKGGQGKTLITRPWQTNAVSFSQSDNPSTPSRQTVQSEQTVEYGRQTTDDRPLMTDFRPPTMDRAMPVRIITKDRTDTTIGAAQK